VVHVVFVTQVLQRGDSGEQLVRCRWSEVGALNRAGDPNSNVGTCKAGCAASCGWKAAQALTRCAAAAFFALAEGMWKRYSRMQ
jgi:hypothetical protein